MRARKGPTLKCQHCGGAFYKSPSQVKLGKGKYCSNACHLTARGIDPDPVKNFWKRVDKNGPNGCWVWIGGRDKWGYGDLYYLAKHIQAHRLSWRFLRGDPGKMDVLHKCNNPPCCNPDHLYLGDDLDNARDRQKAGTQTWGERTKRAKLTGVQVRQIRKEFKWAGPRKSNAAELAKRYGVDSSTTIIKAARGDTWSNLK